MPIPAKCQCGAKFAAPDHLAGKAVACPQCKQRLSIPAAAPATQQPAQPAAASAPQAPAQKPAARAPAAGAAGGKIPLRCACGAAFAAPANLAGRRVACPQCKQPVQIPAAAQGAASAPVTRRQPAASAAGAGGGIGELLDEVGVEAKKIGENYCPECGWEFTEGALICVKCGYNRKSGGKLRTETVKKPKSRAIDWSTAGPGPASNSSMPGGLIAAIVVHFLSFLVVSALVLLMLLGIAAIGDFAGLLFVMPAVLSCGLHLAAGIGLILKKKWAWWISVILNGLAATSWGLATFGAVASTGRLFTDQQFLEALNHKDPQVQAVASALMAFSITLVVGCAIGAAIFYFLERAILSSRVRNYIWDQP